MSNVLFNLNSHMIKCPKGLDIGDIEVKSQQTLNSCPCFLYSVNALQSNAHGGANIISFVS